MYLNLLIISIGSIYVICGVRGGGTHDPVGQVKKAGWLIPPRRGNYSIFAGNNF